MGRTKTTKETTEAAKASIKRSTEVTEEISKKVEEAEIAPVTDDTTVYDDGFEAEISENEGPVENTKSDEFKTDSVIEKDDIIHTDAVDEANDNSFLDTIEGLEKEVETYSTPSVKLEEIVANSNNIKESLKEELVRVEEQEEKLKEEIKKSEEKLSNEQKDKLKEFFKYGFGNYWNGQSSGW